MPADNKDDKEEKKESSAIAKTIKKVIAMVFGVLITLLLIFGAVGVLRVLEIKKEADNMVDNFDVSVFRNGETGFIYDVNGEVIATLSGVKEMYYIDYDDIPHYVKQTFLVGEDRNFYEHSGVDYKAIARAVLAIFKYDGKITQGGSTITQQLARNIFLNHDMTVERKIREMFVSYRLEELYTKEQIFEFYVNNIYFANGFYGIEAAAKGYFSKGSENLTLSEAVFLGIIPNNPSKYDPYTGFEEAIIRRDRILKQMLDENAIDFEQYKEAIEQDILLNPSSDLKSNYVETYVRHSATLELMKMHGFEFKNEFATTEDKALYIEEYQKLYNELNMYLFTKGYKIYTSIDLEVQDKLQNVVDKSLEDYKTKNDEGIYQMQGAATVIDNDTGLVVAIVGGREQAYNGYTLNRAYQSFRQPGSSIKPILTYIPAIERGYNANSILLDEKIEGGPTNVVPVYEGNITLRYAIEQSKNTVAWNLFLELTPNVAISYLKLMNFSKIVAADYVPAMSLGGMTYGVSSLEMAAAYSTIENDGIYRNPTSIIMITDSRGNIILSSDMQRTNTKVYDKNAARQMSDILRGVLIRGSAKGYDLKNAIAAAKTGSTNNDYDNWIIGYSSYYTTSVWIGYDYPKTIDKEGKKKSKIIWNDIMTYLHDGLSKVEFPKPDYTEETQEQSNVIETTSAKEEVTEEFTTYEDDNQLYEKSTVKNPNKPYTGSDKKDEETEENKLYYD